MSRKSSYVRPTQSGQLYEPRRTHSEQWRRKYLRNRRAWLVYGLVIALFVAAVVVKVKVFAPSCPGSLVAANDGNPQDCVGLTDGSYVFNPILASVEHKILTENQRVNRQSTAQHKQWVAVAYLVPMTLNAGSMQSLETADRQLEGAYIGQWEANHDPAMSDGDAPLIKLYLVNEGFQETRWQVATNQILSATGSPLHVVTVVGLGNSITATRQAATQMSAPGVRLAMFGSKMTADDLNGSRYQTLVRVAPTNDDEVQGALEFLSRTQRGVETAMLVKDTDTNDDYVKNWASDVMADYRGANRKFVSLPATFDPSLPSVGNLLQQDAQVVCGKHPDVVLFAGRAQQLEVFVGALGADCTNAITVVSGDDDVIDSNTSSNPQDYTSFQNAIGGRVVSLYGTELASCREWSNCGIVPPSQVLAARAFGQFQLDYQHRVGEQLSDLSDASDVMLSRDAVITAVTAVRRSESQEGDNATQPYPYRQATQGLAALQFTPVTGVSGIITIGNDGSTKGNVENKPLVIMQHLRNGEQCRAIETPVGHS